jgi:hypothetical protein
MSKVKGRPGTNTASYPLPQMDWDMIRRYKRDCEYFCNSYSVIYGGCVYKLVPGVDCDCSLFRIIGNSVDNARLDSLFNTHRIPRGVR